MKALLKGKIISQLFINNKHYSIIAEPAKDEWSQPSAYKVQSDYPLGKDSDIVSLQVDFSGYIKSKPYKDKQTGQNKIYEEQVLYMTAIPAPQK